MTVLYIHCIYHGISICGRPLYTINRVHPTLRTSCCNTKVLFSVCCLLVTFSIVYVCVCLLFAFSIVLKCTRVVLKYILALRWLHSILLYVRRTKIFQSAHMSQDGSTVQHEDLKLLLLIMKFARHSIKYISSFQRFSNSPRPQCDISYIGWQECTVQQYSVATQTLIQYEHTNFELC